MREHYRFGCLACGAKRRYEDIIKKTYDLYLKDSVSNSMIRVGLCKACFENKNELCLDHLKTKLHDSEAKYCEETKKVLPDVFKDARFVGRMGALDYLEQVKEVKPKTPSEFLGIITNERN